MSVLRLELGGTHELKPCSCCGSKSVNLTGYVYADDTPRAVYFAGLTEGHPDRAIALAVGIGEWGDGTTPKQRLGFTMSLRTGASGHQVMVINPEESSWSHLTMVGPILSREAALKHPLIGEVFHITDHLVTDDSRIGNYLSTGLLPASMSPAGA